MDHYFSARYLCYKYIVRMLSNYLVSQEVCPEFDWSQMFTILADYPLEFFCMRTVFTDAEGIQGAADLIEVLGR